MACSGFRPEAGGPGLAHEYPARSGAAWPWLTRRRKRRLTCGDRGSDAADGKAEQRPGDKEEHPHRRCPVHCPARAAGHAPALRTAVLARRATISASSVMLSPTVE
jgi:hypothetical protein